jgi:hypothetical protein
MAEATDEHGLATNRPRRNEGVAMNAALASTGNRSSMRCEVANGDYGSR